LSPQRPRRRTRAARRSDACGCVRPGRRGPGMPRGLRISESVSRGFQGDAVKRNFVCRCETDAKPVAWPPSRLDNSEEILGICSGPQDLEHRRSRPVACGPTPSLLSERGSVVATSRPVTLECHHRGHVERQGASQRGRSTSSTSCALWRMRVLPAHAAKQRRSVIPRALSRPCWICGAGFSRAPRPPRRPPTTCGSMPAGTASIPTSSLSGLAKHDTSESLWSTGVPRKRMGMPQGWPRGPRRSAIRGGFPLGSARSSATPPPR
jgi:hypothetical protein